MLGTFDDFRLASTALF